MAFVGEESDVQPLWHQKNPDASWTRVRRTVHTPNMSVAQDHIYISQISSGNNLGAFAPELGLSSMNKCAGRIPFFPYKPGIWT